MNRYENGEYTRIGRIYHNMKTRCYNQNYDRYQYYGGKGVKICDEWLNSYDEFESWALSHGYTDDMTIDRIDTNGDYSPLNCRWVSRKVQANNRTSNHMIELNGRVQTLIQWAEEYGLLPETVYTRINTLGWSPEKALTTPIDKTWTRHPLTYNGETKSLAEWSRITGIKETTISSRINRNNWSVEKALTTPVGGRA